MLLGRPISIALGLLSCKWFIVINAETTIFSCMQSVYKKDDSSCMMLIPPLQSPFKEIASLAYNHDAHTLYFSATEKCGTRSSIFASKGNASRCHYYGYGLKKIAFDWVTLQIYIAVDNKGIGVCTLPKEHPTHKMSFRKCSHLVTAHRHQTKEGYTHLLVYPKRGLLIWLDHNSDYPKGVVMCAGMDGKKPRILLPTENGEINSIALDYAGDQLIIADGKGSWSLKFDKLLITVSNAIMDLSRSNSSLMLQNGIPEFASECEKHRTEEIESIAISGYNGDESLGTSCETLGCPHMCVLGEVTNSSLMLKCDSTQGDRLKGLKSSDVSRISWHLMLFFFPAITIVFISTSLWAYETITNYLLYAKVVNS